MCSNRQCVVFHLIAVCIHNLDGRNQFTVTVFRDYFVLETSLFINLHLVRSPLDNILVSNLTRSFRDDYSVVWIPLNNLITLFQFVAILHFKDTTIRDVVRHYRSTRLHVDQTHFTSTADYDVITVFAFNGTNIFQFNFTVEFGQDFVFFRYVTCSTPNVEENKILAKFDGKVELED